MDYFLPALNLRHRARAAARIRARPSGEICRRPRLRFGTARLPSICWLARSRALRALCAARILAIAVAVNRRSVREELPARRGVVFSRMDVRATMALSRRSRSQCDRE